MFERQACAPGSALKRVSTPWAAMRSSWTTPALPWASGKLLPMWRASRALGDLIVFAHLCARHHHGDGGQRARAGDHALSDSSTMPGAGRFHDPRRALRYGGGPQLHPMSATGNNVCHSLMLTGAQTRHQRDGRDSSRLLTRYRNRHPGREIAEQNRCEVRLLQDSAGIGGRSRRGLHRRVRQHGLRARVDQGAAPISGHSR